MPNLFDVEDPRGYQVYCTDECWNFHILDEHPEMEGEEAQVIQAICNPYPFCIFQDKDYQNRNIYYRREGSNRYYTKVVVEFSEDNLGEVITAFQPDSPKSGEIMIWPTSNV